MKKYKELTKTDLENIVGGGKKDYNFGYNIGKTINKGVTWVWNNTFGWVSAY